MNLEEKFRELKTKGEGAHMPHVYFGDPHEEFSLRLIETLAENGADILEFGIPFSDPTADGVHPRHKEAARQGCGNPDCGNDIL
jgi:tryptophan synthase alpha subunit